MGGEARWVRMHVEGAYRSAPMYRQRCKWPLCICSRYRSTPRNDNRVMRRASLGEKGATYVHVRLGSGNILAREGCMWT
jgi:hypothetical protein